MIVTSIFFCLELIQISVLKFDYFTKEGDHHEILWFFIQLVYFIFKLNSTNVPMPLNDYVEVYKEGGKINSSITMMMIQSFLNIILVMMFTKQMAYFMTYKHTFGTMIDLVYRTLS
jgi:hypothetical protein